MLAALARQSRPVEHLIVVDNASDPRVAGIAESHGATYLDSGDNIGPAGGFALGVAHALERAADNDWLLLVDDDDEPSSDDALRELYEFGGRLSKTIPRLGGVGIGGSVYRPRLGTFRRLEDVELIGTVDLDVLFGGSLPMYCVRAVRDVGLYDTDLFWGFEEGDYGLRMRAMGYRLCAPGDLFLRSRERAGTASVASRRVRTPLGKPAWRRYYSVRNSTVLARRYGGPFAPLVVGLGGATKGAVSLARSARPFREVSLPARGALDAFRTRLGRRVDPGRNDKAFG